MALYPSLRFSKSTDNRNCIKRKLPSKPVSRGTLVPSELNDFFSPPPQPPFAFLQKMNPTPLPTKEMGFEISGPCVASEDRVKMINSDWMTGKNDGIAKIDGLVKSPSAAWCFKFVVAAHL
jgi:hypothetical protein